MSHASTMLKVGMTDLILRMLEAGVPLLDLAIDNPVQAIRTISHDLTGTAKLDLVAGGTISATNAQEVYLKRVRTFVDGHGLMPHDEWVLDLWQRGIDAVRSGDYSAVETELDWAIKKRVIDRYVDVRDVPLDDPRVLRLDLAYHDISPLHGIFHKLMDRGLALRMVSEEETREAMTIPPQTTRAKLRGDFVTAATTHRRDYTVDWVHLKVNDYAGRTVLCQDPFVSEDPRVDELIDLIRDGS